MKKKKQRPRAPLEGLLVFTTGQAAKICHVAPRTISAWMDSGELPAYRLPTAQRRRLTTRANLLKFLTKHGMPSILATAKPFTALVVGADPDTVERLQLEMIRVNGGNLAIVTADCPFSAGQMIERHQPDLAVIDLAIGRSQGIAMAAVIQGSIALACEDENDMSELDRYFSTVFQKPFDIVLLAETILTFKEKKSG